MHAGLGQNSCFSSGVPRAISFFRFRILVSQPAGAAFALPYGLTVGTLTSGFAITTALGIFGVLAVALNQFWHHPLARGFVWLFDLNTEHNLPSLFHPCCWRHAAQAPTFTPPVHGISGINTHGGDFSGSCSF